MPSSSDTSLSAEWFAKFREQRAHFQSTAGVEGCAEFLHGHVGHGRNHLINVMVHTVLGTELISRTGIKAARHLTVHAGAFLIPGSGIRPVHGTSIHKNCLSKFQISLYIMTAVIKCEGGA